MRDRHAGTARLPYEAIIPTLRRRVVDIPVFILFTKPTGLTLLKKVTLQGEVVIALNSLEPGVKDVRSNTQHMFK